MPLSEKKKEEGGSVGRVLSPPMCPRVCVYAGNKRKCEAVNISSLAERTRWRDSNGGVLREVKSRITALGPLT